MKNFTFLTVLIMLCVLTVNAQPKKLRGGIIISEFLTDPTIGTEDVTGYDTNNSGVISQDDEFVEIYNMGSSAISLNGIELYDDKGQRKVFPDVSLESGAYAVVVAATTDGSLPEVSGNNLAFESIEGTLGLKNTDGLIYLYDPTASEYLVVSYGEGDTDPVPFEGENLTNLGIEDAGVVTEGYSLVRTTPTSGVFGAFNTVCNCEAYASPGFATADVPTSSHEIISSNLIKVYPNPMVNSLNIESEEIINVVKIFSITGQLIHQTVENSYSPNIDVSELKSGLYLLKVSNDNNEERVFKIQKQ